MGGKELKRWVELMGSYTEELQSLMESEDEDVATTAHEELEGLITAQAYRVARDYPMLRARRERAVETYKKHRKHLRTARRLQKKLDDLGAEAASSDRDFYKVNGLLLGRIGIDALPRKPTAKEVSELRFSAPASWVRSLAAKPGFMPRTQRRLETAGRRHQAGARVTSRLWQLRARIHRYWDKSR